MATPAQRTNTWTLDEWYDQAVAGTQGSYSGTKELWAWGRNSAGVLGLDSPGSQDTSSPTQIPGTTWTTPIISGSGGGGVSSALKTDGTLWSWGEGAYGGLGQNDTTSRSSPIQVGTDTTWAGGGVGYTNQYIVKTDGTLWSWGNNTEGQLGHNTAPQYSSPKQVGTDTTWSGAIGKISASEENSVLSIKTDGTLWAWGSNDHGVLGNDMSGGSPGSENQRSSPCQIPGTWTVGDYGRTHGLAINSNNELWSWGYNTSGQLGHNDQTSISSPVQVGTETTWSSIQCSRQTSFGLKTDGTLWAWGFNNEGQLGLNESAHPVANVYRSSPTQIGADTTWSFLCSSRNAMSAIKTDGTLWVWGSDEYGQLGLNEGGAAYGRRSSPTQVPGTTWHQLTGTYDNFIAIKQF